MPCSRNGGQLSDDFCNNCENIDTEINNQKLSMIHLKENGDNISQSYISSDSGNDEFLIEELSIMMSKIEMIRFEKTYKE